MMRLIHIVILILSVSMLTAQTPPPVDATDDRILIRYGRAHIGNGQVIDNSYIEIQNGEISRVSNANSARINEADYSRIIDAEGKEIFPGFTVMDSRLGLVEIGAVRATHDYRETGKLNSNVRALPAFNTESKVIATVRSNGVLMAQIAPVGGTISGSSSLVHFYGWTWQDASIKADEGVYMNWPRRYRKTGWWAEPGPTKPNKKYDEQVREIDAYMASAKAYAELEDRSPKNLRFESLVNVLNGDGRLYVRAQWARDILDVIQFSRKHKIKNIAIVGGAEAHMVTTELKENNIPVIIDRVHKLPLHEDSPIDEPFALASNLIEAGVVVAFASSGDMEAMISRNLPFHAGTAVQYGLEYEKAIELLTLNPAIICGVADRYGSIEPGKAATLFISTGDPLDIRTNNVVQAFVEGKEVDLSNHQQALYEKFAKKHGIEP